ncbi:MAG: hypothetical protein ABIP48_15150 [Planctomycetota bacterium]
MFDHGTLLVSAPCHHEPHVPIRIFNATRVSVRGYRVEDGRELISGAIEVTEDCGAVDVRDNALRRKP